MLKNKNIKFIQIENHILNIDNIVKIYELEDGRTCVIRGRGNDYYNESVESIKKRLKPFMLDD